MAEGRQALSDKDQVTQFANELDKLVERFRAEYNISYAGVVGTLEIKAWLLCQEASERKEDEA